MAQAGFISGPLYFILFGRLQGIPAPPQPTQITQYLQWSYPIWNMQWSYPNFTCQWSVPLYSLEWDL